MRRWLVLAMTVTLTLGLLAPAPATGAQGPWWVVPAEENVDLPPGLLPYHEIAPTLRDIERRSNRVKVEVIGQSVEGRDLYLVTVSDPSAFGRLGRYQALRQLMLRDPERAQARAADFEDFKVPIFINGSIHGNEWEGVDASIRLIERLAFQNDPETRAVLDNAIVLFNVVHNPDGRIHGTRANANGFDLNRDSITLSQPEARIMVEQLVRWNPMVMLDLHGYVNPYLIEPTTPPHNPNYEYDLYIKWALDQAEAMEARLFEETGLPAQIPFRDFAFGWDDWPPIFAPMYAMYHGAYGATLETPLRVNGPNVNDPPEVRRANSETNTRAHMATSWGAMLFAAENRQEMVHDQIEVFRRGWLAEPQVPISETHGEQHDFLAEFPEAYVIPMGNGQRSETSAVRLVNHLLDNDVEVERASRPFTVGGTTHPAGSYVVRMNQPKRGLANTMLEPGWDITDVVPIMFDISGWSHGLLWGADVDIVPEGTSLVAQTTRVSQQQRAQGSAQARGAAWLELLVNDPAGVRAVNHLLDLGFALQRTDDGRVFAPSAARTEAQRLANSEGLVFRAATAVPPGAEPLESLRVAAALVDAELFVLRNLGFEVDRVSNAVMNAGFQLDEHDVLFVSAAMTWTGLNADARAEVRAFLADGGGLVTRGSTGAAFNRDAEVLPVSFTTGPGSANGIGRVVNADDSPVTSTGPEHTFAFAPLWFTDLGTGVSASQRYEDDDFFVSGHWIGQGAAAGQVTVVHGETDDGRAVLFGTEPLFRSHPRGLYHQAGHALWWSASG
jgi:hypothetical protein